MDLTKILDLHQKWLNGEEGGERAYLQGADLRDADLRGADLRDADLRDADLRDADLRDADLRGADLQRANLERAYLQRANLQDADLPDFQICPEEGSFIGWKKAGGLILKLLIRGRRTSSLVGRKCRTDCAEVLEVYRVGSNSPVRDRADDKIRSSYDTYFVYQRGRTALEPNYDDDIRVECTTGIHFFMTRAEAERW